MCLRLLQTSGLALALLTLPFLSFGAAAQIAVSANDNKAVLVNGVNTVPPKSGRRHRHHRQSGRLAAEGDRRTPSAEQRGRSTTERGDHAPTNRLR